MPLNSNLEAQTNSLNIRIYTMYTYKILRKEITSGSYLRVIGVGHNVLAIGGCKLERMREFVGFIAARDLL